MLQQQVSQEIRMKYIYFVFIFSLQNSIFLFLPFVTIVSFYFPKNVFSIVGILKNELNNNDNISNFMDNGYDNDI